MSTKKQLRSKIMILLKQIDDLKLTIEAKDVYQLYITQENDRLQKNCSAMMTTLTVQQKELDRFRQMYKGSEIARKKVTEKVYELRGEVKSLETELQYYKDYCDSEAAYEKAKGNRTNEAE